MNAKEARLSEAEVGYDLGEENTVDGSGPTSFQCARR